MSKVFIVVRRWEFVLGMSVGVALVAIGLVCYLGSEEASGISLLSVGLGEMAGWGGYWLINRYTVAKRLRSATRNRRLRHVWIKPQAIARPLKQLAGDVRALVNTDLDAFADALTALAQGDLTTRLALPLHSLSSALDSNLSELEEVFNDLLASLQESARDFNMVTDEPCQRLFYVGADSFQEGRACGEVMGQVLGGQGQVAVIVGSFTHLSLTLRRRGFESLLREKYPRVQVVDVAESQFKAEVAYTVTRDFLKRYPNLAGIYVATAGGAVGASRAVSEAGMRGRVKVICHDLLEDTIRYLEQGVVTATLGQDPFAQGHDPVIHLFNHLVAGWRPATPRLLTATDVVTRENYHQFWQTGRGVIESDAMAQRRARPGQPSPRPLRIAVLGREVSAFWNTVRAGAMAAADELRAYNATVEWINPGAGKSGPDLATYGPAIEALVEQGYHAIATDISDRGLIPCVNRAVAAGVPVGVFNGEPSSLRGLLTMLAQRAQRLLDVSQELAAFTSNSSEATQQIAATLQQMAQSVNVEAGAVSKANENVQQVTQIVGAIAQGAAEQAAATQRVALAADQITRAVSLTSESGQSVASAAAESVAMAQRSAGTLRQIVAQMQNIQTATDAAAVTIRQMNVSSRQIGDIIDTIKDFAEQTNLLALNANIEAARAGAHGRGFAVVANEVRKLAEKSAGATAAIAEIVGAVQQSIVSAGVSMEAVMQHVQDGGVLAARSGEALQQLTTAIGGMQQQTAVMVQTNTAAAAVQTTLAQAIDRVSAIVEENIAATQRASANIQELLGTIESVAAISQQNAASAEEISASTEEVSAQAVSVGSMASTVSAIAGELLGATAAFKVEPETANPARTPIAAPARRLLQKA